jgi:hypothetical protein
MIEDMVLRILFLLLALAVLVILLSGPPGGIPEAEPLPRRLFLVGMLVTCLGMSVPWGRWIVGVSPGGDLGFLSKLFGWAGASGLPLMVVQKAWIPAGACVLMPLVAFALWERRPWAAWAWYAIAMSAFGFSLFIAIFAFVVPIWIGPFDPHQEVAGVIVTYAIVTSCVLFWGWVGFVLTRDVTSWRQQLRAVRSPTPAS